MEILAGKSGKGRKRSEKSEDLGKIGKKDQKRGGFGKMAKKGPKRSIFKIWDCDQKFWYLVKDIKHKYISQKIYMW